MEIFRTLQIKSVNLLVPPQKSACDIGGQGDALTPPSKERIIASIIDKSAGDLALKRIPRLSLDRRGSSDIHVKNVELGQAITECTVNEGEQTFARIDRKTVLPLIVN